MKKSIPMMLIGLLIMISVFPLYFLLKGQICLMCLFSPIIFITGLAILISGIITLAKGMKKDGSGVEINEDTMNLESLLEPFFLIRDALVRIVRNRRRSTAMLSGIILSSLVIGSVFIFTDAMQEDFYNDFVKAIPWEASFTYKEEGNETYLWDLGDRFSDDERIESYTVVSRTNQGGDFDEVGDYDEFTDTFVHFSTFIPHPKNASEELRKVYESFEPESTFVRYNFINTTIYDKVFNDKLEGSFNLDPGENRTVIPRSKANRLFIEVGDTIGEIVFDLRFEPLSEEEGRPGKVELRLRNVTVVGIFDDSGGEEESSNFFFNTELLDRYGPEMKMMMEKYHLFVLAVKIDPSEFDTSDMDQMVKQVGRLVRDIEREADHDVVGVNNIADIAFMLNIIRYVLIVVDFIMILPVVILSIYFLIFGLDLSLEERKREVAILKVQGANTSQIFGMFSAEAFILFVAGLSIGYFLSIVAAWFINSSIGFMNFDLATSDLEGLIGYHQEALMASAIIVGLIVLVSVFIKAKRFIKQEVSEGVQKLEERKKNFFQMFYIDMVLLVFGAISAIKVILAEVFDITEVMGIRLGFGSGWDTFLFIFLGTIALWVGGALSGPRLSQWTSLRSEGVFLRLFFLKDVALVIKSGLRRRGDTAKLVLIIVLTLSVATLASVQGLTDQRNSERNLEYQIGADLRMTMLNGGDHVAELERIEGIDDAMPIPFEFAMVYSRETIVFGIDAGRASYLEWHMDSFMGGFTASEALRDLERTENGVFFGKDLASEMGIKVGETFDLTISKADPVMDEERAVVMEAVLVAVYDHFPGEIGGSSVICDHSTMLKIRSLKNDHDIGIERTVPVVDPKKYGPIVDNTPEHAFGSIPFAFDITVPDTTMVEEVLVNWSRDDRNGNISLFEIDDSYFAPFELKEGYSDVKYRIHVLDIFGNINSSEEKTIEVHNIMDPNRVLDLGSLTGIQGMDYKFIFSLGPNVQMKEIFLNWEQGSRRGNITPILVEDIYTARITLDSSWNDLHYTLTVINPDPDLDAIIYLADIENGADRAEVRKGLDRNLNISDYRDLAQEKDDISDQINFGIPGLLTMMFVASLIAVFTSAFAFSSIIIKRRMREFAVLQTVGASRWQVYKIAIGENALVMFVSVVMGLLVGIGLSYLMNGFFELLGLILGIGSGSLQRLVFFPWQVILGISCAIFIGMLVAVAVSAVSAARQDLAVSTRVI